MDDETRAAALTNQVRQVLDPVFDSAEGGQVTLGAVRDRIEEEFDAEAAERVGLACRTGTGDAAVVVDVRLSLPRVVDMSTDGRSLSPGDLLAKSPPISSDRQQGSIP